MSLRLSRHLSLCLFGLSCLSAWAQEQTDNSPPLRPEDTPALPAEDLPAIEEPAAIGPPAENTPAFDLRPVNGWLEAQVELHRRGFSCGSIDGVRGPQTSAALKSFQLSARLDPTGDLNLATREALLLQAPATIEYEISIMDLGGLRPLPDTWLGKSEEPELAYETVLERLAERFRASPKFLMRTNPQVDWHGLLAGVRITVPNVGAVHLKKKAALLHVRLAEHVLTATDSDGEIIAHFPVSIAKKVEKRPVGELVVTVVIPDPNYTVDPVNFPESDEMQQLGRKLILPPGPNNPVGVAWIGLNRPGYGMHGTPEPEHVGRTESHGCFRLANWDARTLLDIAWSGLPVVVEP